MPFLYRGDVAEPECRETCAAYRWCRAYAAYPYPGSGVCMLHVTLEQNADHAPALRGWASMGTTEGFVVGALEVAGPLQLVVATCTVRSFGKEFAHNGFVDFVLSAEWVPSGQRSVGGSLRGCSCRGALAVRTLGISGDPPGEN